MEKNFEFKQLLRAYRKGIIDEATFEQEVATLENGAGANGGGFIALGRSFGCERDAVLYFLDRVGSAEGAAEVALRKWDAIAKRTAYGGIRMVAERRLPFTVFERRLRELGGTKKEDGGDTARQLAYYADPNLRCRKLLRATSSAVLTQ